VVGFSLFQSTGVAIGLGLTNEPQIVGPVVLSFAGGTFVYIACSEIIVHEFASKQLRYVKYLFFLIGFGIITSLWLLH
jgi:zinc transporter ZupT